MWSMPSLRSEPLCYSSPKRCQLPSAAGWDVSAPSKLLSTTSLGFYCQWFFLVRSLKAELKSVPTRKQWSKEWEYHVVPMRSNICPRGDLCLLVLTLSETGLRHFPLAWAPPLSTAQKVSKFSFLLLRQLQSQSTSFHLLQKKKKKKALGHVLNQTRICLSLDVMNHESLPICAFWPLTYDGRKQKSFGEKWK